jgi:Sec-independent protein translocase protein TatA
MDPVDVLRRIWQQRWFALPALVIAIVAAVLVFLFGPRDYESTASYALVNPDIPTAAEIAADPALGKLDANNPYLRSSDPTLVGNVAMTQLNAPGTADELQAKGLGTTYTAAPAAGASGFIVQITASGSTPAQSIATTKELGIMFTGALRSIQTVDGADDRYLYTALEVSTPDRATEKLSSRLRTVIIVAVGGVILIFAAISLGTWVSAMRRRRNAAAAEAPANDDDSDADAEVEVDAEDSQRDASPAGTAPRA